MIGPDGAVHAGPDGLRCLARIVGPDALSWRTAPGPTTARHLPVGQATAAGLALGLRNFQV